MQNPASQPPFWRRKDAKGTRRESGRISRPPEDCEIVILPRAQLPHVTACSTETEPLPIAYFAHNRYMTILSKP